MRSLNLLFLIFFLSADLCAAQSETQNKNEVDAQVAQSVEALDKPLYNPFIERYMLDDLKALRIEMASQRAEFTEKLVDRDLSIGDRALSYSEKTVTYFFYLIAATSSVLVLVGWRSLTDLRDKVHSAADEQIKELVETYEERLRSIEAVLVQKTDHINENRLQIEQTQEVHALWLRAAQEPGETAKIAIYDEILKLRPSDCEALTYKADAVLDLGEPLWAKNLSLNALSIDALYVHAHYQLACAHVALKEYEEAILSLERAFRLNESIIDDIRKDKALAPLYSRDDFLARFSSLIDESKLKASNG